MHCIPHLKLEWQHVLEEPHFEELVWIFSVFMAVLKRFAKNPSIAPRV